MQRNTTEVFKNFKIKDNFYKSQDMNLIKLNFENLIKAKKKKKNNIIEGKLFLKWYMH